VIKEIFLGWDIGGANTKICVFNSDKKIIRVHKKNINILDDFNDINSFFNTVLDLYKDFEITSFITITAESCDNFKDRKEGIILILSECDKNIVGQKYYYTNKNTYVDYSEAIKAPDKLFSTNWMLTSNFSTRTLFFRSTLYGSNMYLKSNSVTENETNTSPATGSSGENLIGCHLGILGISLLVLSSVQS
jgi:uncharacterized hydantoinase/oxoprolinase family protein